MERDYAFAPPHRITLSRPCASEKTLADFYRDHFTLSWSYESLRQRPVNIWHVPNVEWGLTAALYADGRQLSFSDWHRPENWLPGFSACAEAEGTVRAAVSGLACRGGDVIRITFTNTGRCQCVCAAAVELTMGGWVIANPAWIDGRHADLLLCMENARPDRILIAGFGADCYPMDLSEEAQGEISVPMPNGNQTGQHCAAKTTTAQVTLAPSQSSTIWFYRPYEAYESEYTKLSLLNFEAMLEDAKAEWRKTIGNSIVSLGDASLTEDFRACLSDAFVMREPDSAGHIVACPGTWCYRSPNSGEACLTAMLLDRVGLSRDALEEQVVHLEAQGADGNWNDPLGWVHHMWGVSGYKARMVMDYYRNHRDRAYLERQYPRMLASARWNEKARQKTRTDPASPTYGLLPRGLGDCGLMNGGDFFGVFYPQNFYAVEGDRLAMEAATILGHKEEAAELRGIWESAMRDLRLSLEKGRVCDEATGERWIPGTPNKKTGSTWGALGAYYLCHALEKEDPLYKSTLAHIEKHISPGGQPIGTGWMKNGCWVAISLDNLATAKLTAGDGESASRYVISALRYASYFTTWCEERGWQAGSDETSGDLQHLWTPLSVCLYILDAIAFDREGELQLLSGLPRDCLAEGRTIEVKEIPTHFGNLSLTAAHRAGKLILDIDGVPAARVHLRLPGSPELVPESAEGCQIQPDGDTILFRTENRTAHVVLKVLEKGM